jgi:rubredoxin
MIHVCTVCGYQYDDNIQMTPFDQLPGDWACPVCGAPKGAFASMQTDYTEGDG